MSSPTPSSGSIDRTHSLGSLIDQNEYQSLSSTHSPLTASSTSLSSSGGGNSNNQSPVISEKTNGSSILLNGHDEIENINTSRSSSSGCSSGAEGEGEVADSSRDEQVGGISQLSDDECGLCHGTFVKPKVLPCFHTFCEPCLERYQDQPGKITCSRCQQECILSSRGVPGLLPDFTVKDSGCGSNSSLQEDAISFHSSSHCTSCKNLSLPAVVHCLDCNLYLCQDCTVAHQLVNFDDHRMFNVSTSSTCTSPGEVGDIKEEAVIGGNILKNACNAFLGSEKLVPCSRHKTDYLKYFCITCNVPICKECTSLAHPSGLHDFESLTDIGYKQVQEMMLSVEESEVKADDLRAMIKNLDHSSTKLQTQYQKAQREVNDTFLFYRSMLDERKQEILKELESVFSAKQLSINVVGEKSQDTIDKIYQTCDFFNKLTKSACVPECLLFKKSFDSKMQGLMSYTPEISLQNASDLEFVSNYQAIQVGVRNTFGYVRSSGEGNVGPAKQPPIARPINPTTATSSFGNSVSAFMMNTSGNIGGFTNGSGGSNGGSSSSSSSTTAVGNGFLSHNVFSGSRFAASTAATTTSSGSSSSSSSNFMFNGSSLDTLLDSKQSFSNGLSNVGSAAIQNNYESSILSKRFGSSNSGMNPFANNMNDLELNNPLNGVGLGGNTNSLGTYEKWNHTGGDIFQSSDEFSLTIGNAGSGCGGSGGGCGGSGYGGGKGGGGEVLDLTSKLLSNSSIFPPKSQIKRQKMIYHCKFGEFGALEGQFTEPSGVAINAQNDIIVADTNNHRIQIFDKEGRFKFQFGECGKRDGQLLYPNRVAVVKQTGDIVVTERSPTHQIQIYNQYGQFLRKFGATILQHPRGIAVDNKGRIIVVECKVMRVLIFDQMGYVLQKFGCSKHLEFPNGVVVNDRQEIFISDNRAHCVKVFNYDGMYLRQIGNEGITNYPIGVGINAAGEILIADNHNNFNLTIFTQEGQLVSALESKVKHAQCFDVALMDSGSVVLASKDYRLYIYRYLQVPTIGL